MSAYDDAIKAGAKPYQNSKQTGDVTTSATIITFDKETRAIELFNSHAVANLLYSLDGTTYLAILPHGSVDKPYRTNALYLKSSTGTVTYYFDAAIAQ